MKPKTSIKRDLAVDDSLKVEINREISKKELLKNPVLHYDAEAHSGVSDLLEAFSSTGFQSRNLGRCYRVLMKILQDSERPVIFMGLAGAMVPAGMRKVVRDMMKYHIVDVLVSTGANLYHDLYEALGFHHHLATSNIRDERLRELRIDRMLDVYADDDAFTNVDIYIKGFADGLEARVYSSREFLSLLGAGLKDRLSILYTASEEKIPIFCPSIADSSIGIALAVHRAERERQGLDSIIIDNIKDNLEILKIKADARKTAGIYIGGGVPKNYIQQITPMAEVLGIKIQGHSYGIQITTDDPKWGGLSGCTFEESKSWGKYIGDASFATAYMDATIALPLLFKAVMERSELWYPRPPYNIDF